MAIKTSLLAMAVAGALLTGGTKVSAMTVVDSVLFADDFEAGSLDLSKWTTSGANHPTFEPGCSLSVSGGVLHSYFTGQNAPSGAFARSVDISLPAGWTVVEVTGQWGYPTRVYGEMCLSVWPDGNRAHKSIDLGYYNWGGPALRAMYSLDGTTIDSSNTYRSIPGTLVDFKLTITPTGWTFADKATGSWEELVNFSTNLMAGSSSLQVQIGGWEYSPTATQEVVFDNIQVRAIPEPATLAVLGLGALAGLLRPRRR